MQLQETHSVADSASSTRLFRDQRGADHFRCILSNLLGTATIRLKKYMANGMELPVNHMHTALKPVIKPSLSTTTGKDLRFYDKSVMTYES